MFKETARKAAPSEIEETTETAQKRPAIISLNWTIYGSGLY